MDKQAIEQKYEGFREVARERTRDTLWERILPAKLPIELYAFDFTSISDAALKEAEGWNFRWRRIVGQTRPYLRRFEVAVWKDGRLLGLAVGRASRGPDNVTIHYLERSRADNPLATHFAMIALDATDNYAKIISRQRVKLKNPAPGVIKKYQALGFSLAETYRGATYYERRVVP